MINSGEGSSSTSDIYANYTLGDDGDQVFDDNFFTKVENYVLNKEADLHVRFGNAMKDYCDKNNMDFPIHYIMTEEIDRNKTSGANLIYSFRFPSDIGVNMSYGVQTQGVAAYEFYTNPIKLTFDGKSEIKLESIYKELNTTIGMDITDTLGEGARSIPLYNVFYGQFLGGNRTDVISNNDETPKFVYGLS